MADWRRGHDAVCPLQVVVGMGTLAGSTVMMLSIAWGGSLIVGRCDINSYGYARDKKLTKSCFAESSVISGHSR